MPRLSVVRWWRPSSTARQPPSRRWSRAGS